MRVSTEHLFLKPPRSIEIEHFEKLEPLSIGSEHYGGPGTLVEFGEPVECWEEQGRRFLIVGRSSDPPAETFVDVLNGHGNIISRNINVPDDGYLSADHDEAAQQLIDEAT